MRRVLIVTSSYAPTMIADMQRVRQLAWELPKLGWEVEVLCPSTEYQPATCVDEDSAAFFSPRFSGTLRAENVAGHVQNSKNRKHWLARTVPTVVCGHAFAAAEAFRFDLYLDGSISLVSAWALSWQRQFGVPYVLDFHDPLYKEGARYPVWARPVSNTALADGLAKHVEAHVAKAAHGLIAVSSNYIDTLRQRYEANQPAWLRPGRCDAIPFSALPRDLCEAAAGLASNPERNGPPYRIVYVGVGGSVMARSFTLFSQALSRLRMRSPNLCEGIRVGLFGTMLGWRPGEARNLADIAAKWGIGDLVREEPGRLSYRRSLELLLQSDGALIFGVDDAGYMPSKLFSYALSGRPLLATLHREGPAFSLFQNISKLGHALWIGQYDDMPLDEATNELETFVSEVVTRQIFDRRTSITPYLAPAMARRHVDLFEACL